MRLSGTEAWDRDATTQGRGPASRALKRLIVVGLVYALVLTGQPPDPALASLDPPVANDQAESTREVRGIGPLLAALLPTLVDLLVGIVAGLLALLAWSGVKRLLPRKSASA